MRRHTALLCIVLSFVFLKALGQTSPKQSATVDPRAAATKPVDPSPTALMPARTKPRPAANSKTTPSSTPILVPTSAPTPALAPALTPTPTAASADQRPLAFASFILAGFAFLVALASMRDSKRKARREATDAIFREWWSEDLRGLRKYFFQEFVPSHRPILINQGKTLKSIDDIFKSDKEPDNKPDNGAKVRQLCFFFDRVGWLAAAGLIDPDDVLGPMQHSMRRVWWAVERFILEDRSDKGGHPDPIYHMGFEWLFKHSSDPDHHHALLLERQLHGFLTEEDVKTLRAALDSVEAEFKKQL